MKTNHNVLWVLVFTSFILKLAALVYTAVLCRELPLMTISVILVIITDSLALAMILKKPIKRSKRYGNVVIMENKAISRNLLIACVFCNVLISVYFVAMSVNGRDTLLTIFLFPYIIVRTTGDTIVTDRGILIKNSFIHYEKIKKCEIVDRKGQGDYYPYISMQTRYVLSFASGLGQPVEIRFDDKEKLFAAYEYISSQVGLLSSVNTAG